MQQPLAGIRLCRWQFGDSVLACDLYISHHKHMTAAVALHRHHICSLLCCRFLNTCLQGPLQSLTVKSISWRSAARSRQARSSDAGDGSSNGSTQQGSAWLPIRIQGVHIVLAAAAKGRSKGSKQRKQHAASSAARSAAAWPAVSTALAAAKRLLPGMPVQLQDVKVELKVRMQRRIWHNRITHAWHS
jgi:hypothetical protein